MSSFHVLDAHILIWFLEGNGRLSRDAQAILDDRDSRLIVPVTALAEACMAVERGRTRLTSYAKLLSAVTGDPRVELLALDGEIVSDAASLTALADLHDRFLVASVRVLMRRTGTAIVLLTNDREIVSSRLVDVLQ